MSSDGLDEEEASMLKKLTVVTTTKGKDMMEDINKLQLQIDIQQCRD